MNTTRNILKLSQISLAQRLRNYVQQFRNITTNHAITYCWFSHDVTKIQTKNYRSYRDFTFTMHYSS